LPPSFKTSVVHIPGAAAPAGINAIKSLRMANFDGKIVATDSTSLSAGFFMADINEILPKVDANFYEKRLFEIVNRHSIEVMMPTSGYDIYPLSENRKRLAEIGAQAIVSDRNVLEICRDKMSTFEKMSGICEVPFTTLDPDKITSFPVVGKPRFGKGSRDIIKIPNESILKYVRSNFDNMVYQEFLPGIEYTIDVLSDMDKKPVVAVPRIRLETKAGISTKGKIVRDFDMENKCLNIAKYVGIRGPCCIQMKESAEGEMKLIEINPRMGGGTIFSTLAGANFPAMILDMLDGKEVKLPKISEITVLRYFEEIVITNENEEEQQDQALGQASLLPKTHFVE
jgi:carbamoyl-phosphate synthase large subunit